MGGEGKGPVWGGEGDGCGRRSVGGERQEPGELVLGGEGEGCEGGGGGRAGEAKAGAPHTAEAVAA